jgi:2-oxo-hept-3-ene-1,7-dioate hydratase
MFVSAFRRHKLALLCSVCTLTWSALAHATCPSTDDINRYLSDYAKGLPSAGFGDLSIDDAECAKQLLARKLPMQLGALSGYKAGFTSEASRKAHRMDAPRWGYMYERNLIDIQAVIPANFGAFPGFDANLIVEVKDAGLADATTPLQALQHIESIVPFIELSDRMLSSPVSGAALIATNLSFRGGVKGPEVPVEASQAFADALAGFTVRMLDDSQDGRLLGQAKGDTLMGHPLNVAIWLAQTLKQQGITLKQGDLLSLGSLIPPQTPLPGLKLRLQYLGLPGEPEVSVEFSEAFDRGR